jgi:integration host factor subunit alpha
VKNRNHPTPITSKEEAVAGMTLTKADITDSVRREVRIKRLPTSQQRYLFPDMNWESLTNIRAEEIVNSLFEIAKESLSEGKDVNISGFGKFQVRFKWARRGRNPQTGEMMILRSRRVVTFKVSPKLRERMNIT